MAYFSSGVVGDMSLYTEGHVAHVADRSLFCVSPSVLPCLNMFCTTKPRVKEHDKGAGAVQADKF